VRLWPASGVPPPHRAEARGRGKVEESPESGAASRLVWGADAVSGWEQESYQVACPRPPQ